MSSSLPRSVKSTKTNFQGKLLIGVGVGLILVGAFALIYSFWPVAEAELKYSLAQMKSHENTAVEQPITPVDDQFGIVIPKINANAPVVTNVDPYNANDYQQKLTKGVAHAQGTGLPNSERTMFLFAHSSGDLLMARRYNSVFYLLSKLEPNDEIVIYYHGAPYSYRVSQLKEVSPNSVEYLTELVDTDLVLMTCTPPGTTWKRLLVLASRNGNQSK